MPVRVSPTDRIRHHIDELFAQDRPLPEILEEVARLGAQLLMQAALEAEVTEFLGRDRYQRAAACEDARPGSRNGYREVTVKTTAGPVELARPKLRGTSEAFASRLFGAHVTKTNALESPGDRLVRPRPVGPRRRGHPGRGARRPGRDLQVHGVGHLPGQIKDEYQAWARRRLDEVTLDYLFLDASFFRMHPGSPAEPVLAAWGITTGGKPAFIGLAPGTGESADAWADFLADLKDRGLACPLLVISDGAPGPDRRDRAGLPQGAASTMSYPPCRNILAKIPAGMQAEVKDAYWKIFDTEDLKTPARPAARGDHRCPDHRDGRQVPATYPSAMKCLLTDREGLTAYLRFPAEHHKRIRHSNFIERTFGETRRRVKVIGRLPGETSCLTLVWAVLDRASRGWRGLTMTADGLRLLQDLRRSLLEPPRQLRPRTVTASQADDRPETVSAIA